MAYRTITGKLYLSTGGAAEQTSVRLIRDRTGWIPAGVYVPDVVVLKADSDGDILPGPNYSGPTETISGKDYAQIWASEGSDRLSSYRVEVAGEVVGMVLVPEGASALEFQDLLTIGAIEGSPQYETLKTWIDENADILQGPKGDQGDPGLNWRGAWAVGTAYAIDDVVEHDGTAYVAVAAHTGSEPPSANWEVLASKGDTGDTGATGDEGPTGPQGPQGDPGLVWRGAWDMGTSYAIDDVVEEAGSAYVAITANSGDAPPSANWELLASKGDTGDTGATGPKGDTGDIGITWRGEWNSGTAYVENDGVEYNGSSYISIQAGTNQTPDPAGTAFWDLVAEKGADGAGAGDVVGPASATDSNLAAFDGTTGELIKDAGQSVAGLQTNIDGKASDPHDLGGASHGSATLAQLNAKVSDATLDDSGSSRTPTAHDLGGALHNSATLAELSAKVSDADLVAKTNGAITNPTITNYVETLHTESGTAITVELSDGTVQKLTTTGNITITLPAASAGKSFVIMVAYGGVHTVTWAGGTAIEWAGGTAPDATSESGKVDIFAFFQDAGVTYGSVIGQDFA